MTWTPLRESALVDAEFAIPPPTDWRTRETMSAVMKMAV